MNPENPQNRRIVLSQIPIDGESRAVSKKVQYIFRAQQTKKLERFEIFKQNLKLFAPNG